MIEVKLDNISKSYNKGDVNELNVLTNLTLFVPKSSAVSIEGTNGSGKTTLLKVIEGSLNPDIGNVYFDEQNVTNYDEIKRSVYISKVHQNPLLDLAPTLTLEENLIISLMKNEKVKLRKYSTSKRTQYVKNFLEKYDFSFLNNRLLEKVTTFSGGQKQIISLLSAIISKPQILLLDEPTSNLDHDNTLIFTDIIKKIQIEFQPTIIIISHHFKEISTITSNHYKIESGQLIQYYHE